MCISKTLRHACLALLAFVALPAFAGPPTIDNPIVLQRADPWIVRDEVSGCYWFIGTAAEFDRIEIRHACRLNDLKLAEPKVVWRMRESGPMSANIWAPELHRIDGAWYIYFAAGDVAKHLGVPLEQAHRAAGQPFNLGSPKQIQQLLFDKLQLPVLAKTPKGAPSTAESVLQELALDYPLPRLILEHRSLSKLKSTYTDKLPQQVCERTGRVHTSYHQAVAATGRLSSSDPNLQNIPIRTPEGRRIRQAFIAPRGHVLLAADYSQIELRIMAHLSGDEGLQSAFAAGQDIHRATAAEVFDTEFDDVSDEQRRSAKAVNFGLMYGMSAFGLARQLNVPRGQAQEYIDLYFERYPGVKAFMDDIRDKARKQGFVETVFGRRLYLPEIDSRNPQRRQYAERTAINAPMQGTAADIIKRAMITVQDWLLSSKPGARMIMQVHDELVFEVEKDAVDAVRDKVVALMEDAADLDVALKVDAGAGKNWDEAH